VGREAFSFEVQGFWLIVWGWWPCYRARMTTCDKCKGTMLLERAVDLNAGLVITVLACLNCGRRRALDPEPKPMTARC